MTAKTTTTATCATCLDHGTVGAGYDQTPCRDCTYGQEVTEQVSRTRIDLRPVPAWFASVPRNQMIPTCGSKLPARQLTAFADLLRTFAERFEISNVTVRAAAYYDATLTADVTLSYAYNTEEAVEALAWFTTLADKPGTLWLGPARMRGVHSVRTLEAKIVQFGSFIARLEAVIDTTGSESIRSVARALTAARAKKEAAQ
jgi:hypothetical protein